MRHDIRRYLLIFTVIAGGLAWDADADRNAQKFLITTAEAVVGRPATPVSYAGVARRTTVRVATPGLGAPGVGMQPANRGGPVNRIGRR
jgi:hypothetical protein